MSLQTKRIIILVICVVAVVALWVRQSRINALFRQVNSNDMEVRVDATRKLLERDIIPGGLPGQKVIVRSKITQALSRIGDEEAVGCLITLLDDFEASPRRWASSALVEIGPSALPSLSQVLVSGSERARRGAVDALGQMGEEAIPFLRELLSQPGAQADAVVALGRIGEQAKSAAVAEAAFDPLIRAISNSDKDLANVAIPVLGDKQVKAAVEPLKSALEDDAVRSNAIVALGDIGDARATLDLIPFLADESIQIRIITARALGQIADPRAAGPLAATLDERDANYRSALILALQRIGAPGAPLLALRLDSPDVFVRRAAAQSLRGAAVSSVMPALTNAALHDADDRVRAAATLALGWDNNQAAVPVLLEILNDNADLVVDAAVSSLAEIGEPVYPSLFSLFRGEDPVYALFANRTFIQIGEPALPALRQALQSEDDAVRRWAVVTLGDMDLSLIHISEPTRPY